MLDLLLSGVDWVWTFGVPFVVVLSVLVFVHEWGHYAVARHYKVKIDAFSIGFGPELFGWTDKEGCRWKFCAIPLGGFVKMYGDAGAASTPDLEAISHMTAEDMKGAFHAKPVGQRAAIVIAGPAINYIFAIILMAGLFVFNGRPVTPPIAGGVVIGGAAVEAGIRPGDTILSINDTKIERFEDISRFVMIHLDEPMNIVVKRGEETLTFDNVRAQRQELKDRFGFTQTRALLGVTATGLVASPEQVKSINGEAVTRDTLAPALAKLKGQHAEIVMKTDPLATQPAVAGYLVNVGDDMKVNEEDGSVVLQTMKMEVIHYDPITAVGKALAEVWNITVSTLKALWQMIAGVRSAEELGGLLRIGAVASDAAASGIVAYILFTALLSINLGLINLFPIPMLDGGHLVFYAAEAITGKPIPENVQENLFKVGFFTLLVLMVFANGNDLVQLLR